MNWEDELKKEIIALMFDYYDHGANMHTIIPDASANVIIDSVKSLLKNQRDKYYYQIENSVGTKEADYIDKQVNGGS